MAGDEVLRQAAALVRDLDGFENSVYRIGGEEFGGVLVCKDRLQVATLLETLRKRIGDTPLRVEGGVGQDEPG